MSLLHPAHIPHLAPASFTIVMGTGAFAITTSMMAARHPWLSYPAQCLNILNFALFVILLVGAIISWPRNRACVRDCLSAPAKGAFYSAIGISLLVLGAQALNFRFGTGLAICLWTIGCVVTLFLNLGLIMRFFLQPKLELAHITPVFYIPVAALVVIPVAGAPLAGIVGDHPFRAFIIIADFIGVGAGLMLHMGLFSMLLQRHLLLEPIADQLAPTIWIHIAPIGWGAVSIIGIANELFGSQVREMAIFLGAILWGAALWWLIMAALLTIRAAIRRGLKFSLAWWAFIFPIGSITVLSARLPFGDAMPVFACLWALLGTLWLLCVFNTIVLLCRMSHARPDGI